MAETHRVADGKDKQKNRSNPVQHGGFHIFRDDTKRLQSQIPHRTVIPEKAPCGNRCPPERCCALPIRLRERYREQMVLLPLLGAIVTDRGGAVCHTAIVAREFGIAAVVGTGEATARIPDGARISVDGTNGTVAILAGASS